LSKGDSTHHYQSSTRESSVFRCPERHPVKARNARRQIRPSDRKCLLLLLLRLNLQTGRLMTQVEDVLNTGRGNVLKALVDRVRRRLFGNALLAQGVNAANAALSVLILLLLVGTQILNWYWVALIPALFLGGGLYLVTRRLPGPYAVAQIVDCRMGLDDTLSTAMYFSQIPEDSNAAAAGVRRVQAAQAERVAGTVDPRRAAPFRVPRTIYLMAGLFLLAGSLFALRYGLNRTLDLKPPMASFLPKLGWNQKNDLAKNDPRNKKMSPQPDDPNDEAAGKDPDQKGAAQPDPTANNDSGAADPANTDQKGGKSDDKKQSDGSATSAGDEQEAQAEKSSDPQNDSASTNPQNGKSDQSQNGGKQENNNSGDSSFMSKLKDALQNLVSRATPPKNNQN